MDVRVRTGEPIMNKAYKRAIKIVELLEELEEAKEIISNFVWPPDATADQAARFKQQAARFAGCTIPVREATPEECDQCRPDMNKN